VLLTAPGGVSQQFPRDMKKLGGAIARLVRPRPSTSSDRTE
jgi:hypothetical protein